VVIVGSILLAFGIDAWWEGRQERAEETRALESLVSELQENLGVVDQAMQRHDSIVDAAALLARMSKGEVSPPANGAEMLRIFRFSLSRMQSTNFPSGSLTALLASGEIGLIRNSEIRSRVAAWPSVVEEVLEDEQMSLRASEQVYLPFIAAHVPSYYLVGAGVAEQQQAAAEISETLGSDQLEGLLGQRIIRHENVLGDFGRMRTTLSELIKLIGEELEGRRPS